VIYGRKEEKDSTYKYNLLKQSLEEQMAADGKDMDDETFALMKSQAEIDKIRQEESADFMQAQSDLKIGLEGVRKALGVLRDYYASDDAFVQQSAMPEQHVKASSAGTSIIGSRGGGE